MSWHYTVGGQKVGPISDSKFQEAIKSGQIHSETLVWKEGFADWTKFGSLNLEAGGDGTRCAECNVEFDPTEMVNVSGAWVCPGCKPRYVQKIIEGVPTGMRFWRSGKRLMAPLNSTLPRRCVKCNEPTGDSQIKRTLYWHHPGIYLSLLVSILLYVIIAVIFRKKAVINLSMCSTHRASRRKVILTSWLLVFLGVAAFVFGLIHESVWGMVLGGVLFIGAIVYGVVRGRMVYATKITKESVWIGGCKPEFLAQFPEWTGSK